MANLNLFRSFTGKQIRKQSAVNHEGSSSYEFAPEHALAQLAVTGCLRGTFYVDEQKQLDDVLSLSEKVDPEVIARIAVYCRESCQMKDMPALLCAVLSVRSPEHLKSVFARVVNNGRMVRTFVQIMRSGAVGRKSLGSLPRRLVRDWFSRTTDEGVFRAAIGNDPSLADVIKMVHPRPASEARNSLYGYLLGRTYVEERLPLLVRDYEAYKLDRTRSVPDVPFQKLTALDLGTDAWVSIAENAPWQMTRMNLNTFWRHGVFERPGMTELIAERLRDQQAIERSGALPYQLMAAYAHARDSVPLDVREALQDAMEVAVRNVPSFEGDVIVCPDVSYSMTSPITGYLGSATSVVRCVDVAALIAASILRKNVRARVLPFERKVVKMSLNPRDSIMTNASRLASICGGGTNCSAPLAKLNRTRSKGDLVVFVSDNQSWVDRESCNGTAMMKEWRRFKRRNPRARLVCIDIQPYQNSQVADEEDILNIGGFSDQVFSILSRVSRGQMTRSYWMEVIHGVVI